MKVPKKVKQLLNERIVAPMLHACYLVHVESVGEMTEDEFNSAVLAVLRENENKERLP